MCMHVKVCVSVHGYAHMCVHICVHVCMSVHMQLCVNVQVYEYM